MAPDAAHTPVKRGLCGADGPRGQPTAGCRRSGRLRRHGPAPLSEIFRVDASLRQQLARFEADPDATAAFEVLEEHFFMIQDWDTLVSLYRGRLGARSLAEQGGSRRRRMTLDDKAAAVALQAYLDAGRPVVADPGEYSEER